MRNEKKILKLSLNYKRLPGLTEWMRNHAFQLRERVEISKGGRALPKGRRGEEIKMLETEGQIPQRVMARAYGHGCTLETAVRTMGLSAARMIGF